MSTANYSVRCACNKVELRIKSDPVAQSWCHCRSCATFHQTCPVPFAMFKADAVDIVKGKEHVKRVKLCDSNFFGKQTGRRFCERCGFRLFNEPEGAPFRGMPATTILGLDFKPTLHGFCADASEETLKRFDGDGLPRYKDASKEMGGSGELL